MIFQSKRGFAVLGVAVALVILASMAAGLALLTATNQATRTQMQDMSQAFLENYATFEYSLRQIEMGTNPNPIPARDLSGKTLSLSRYYGKIHSVTENGIAVNTYSITDPNPPLESTCLNVDTSSASYRGSTKQLIGLTIQRDTSKCPMPITIVGMVITWSPNANEKITDIQFNNNPQKEWHVPAGQLSGTTFTFSNPFPMPDGTVNQLTDIQWKTSIATNATFTLVFIMDDGSKLTINC